MTVRKGWTRANSHTLQMVVKFCVFGHESVNLPAACGPLIFPSQFFEAEMVGRPQIRAKIILFYTLAVSQKSIKILRNLVK